MKSKIIKLLAVLSMWFAFSAIPADLSAQCPMCRMSAESNLKNGGTEGQGLNSGILYLLAMPYLMIATIGILWWRGKKQAEREEEEKTQLKTLLEEQKIQLYMNKKGGG